MPRVISCEEIGSHVDFTAFVAWLRSELAAGTTQQIEAPQRTMAFRNDPFSVFGAMMAWSPRHALFVTKAAVFMDAREAIGARPVNATVIAYSTTNGQLLGIVDGVAITNLKCAALGALVADGCAHPEARTLAVIGSGTQARQLIKGVTHVRSIQQLRLYSRTPSNVERLAAEIQHGHPGMEVVICGSGDEAVCNADIIGTATTSADPVFSDKANLPKHVHVNCMGAHTVRSRETPRALLQQAKRIVEDVATAVAEAGTIHADASTVEEVVQSRIERPKERPTIFSSTGHAAYDLLTTAFVLKVLRSRALTPH